MMTEKDNKILIFGEVQKQLSIQYMPYFLKEEYKGLANSSTNKEDTEKYFNIVTSIDTGLKKIMRYEKYFSVFYPKDTTIPDHEAFEYHMHSYLQDLYILRNRLICYLDNLKNDMRRIASNKKEVGDVFVYLVAQTKECFENASGPRDLHTHREKIFLDLDLSRAKLFSEILKGPIPPEFDEEKLRQILKQKGEESLEKSKSKWIKIAIDNSIQTSGLVEEIFSRTKDFLYQYLGLSQNTTLL